MPTLTRNDEVTGAPVTLYYEEAGEGFPVLLIAPGGMKSAIPVWGNAPFNPQSEWADEFRVIAMDQRNAGRSSGPVHADHGWQTYTEDQLALLDALGVDRFIVAGMCIGGPYALGLAQAAPERVAGAVLFQPIGLTDNRDVFYAMYDGWREELEGRRDDVSDEAWRGLRENMYGGDRCLFNVGQQEIEAIETPLLVLMGNDIYHPQESSREVVAYAPNATLIEQWKEPESVGEAKTATREFLRRCSA